MLWILLFGAEHDVQAPHRHSWLNPSVFGSVKMYYYYYYYYYANIHCQLLLLPSTQQNNLNHMSCA